jgi:hypothetical protein
MVGGGQVTPHHRDPVTAGLVRTVGRQQLQLPRALHRRGPVTDTELGVDAASDSFSDAIAALTWFWWSAVRVNWHLGTKPPHGRTTARGSPRSGDDLSPG